MQAGLDRSASPSLIQNVKEPTERRDEQEVERLKATWSAYLRRRRLKTTHQRELIVDLFLHRGGHVSIDDLLAQVRGESAGVGYATVSTADWPFSTTSHR